MQVNMELSLIYCNKLEVFIATLDGFNQQAKCFCSLNDLTALWFYKGSCIFHLVFHFLVQIPALFPIVNIMIWTH